jgi:hypothetical protein
MRRTPTIIALLLLAGCSGSPGDDGAPAVSDTTPSLPAPAQAPDDLADLASPHVETLLQNDLLDVHRISLPAGGTLAPHQGGPRVVYSLGAYSLRFEVDGTSETHSFERGTVHAHEAGVHAVENVGEGEAPFVVFERREGSLPPSQAEGETPIAAPEEGADEEVVFESDLAHVHEVTLQPGARLPSHRGHTRVVYSLNAYELAFTSDSGTRERAFEAGEAHIHDPGEHTVENVGDTVAEFVVVEFID